MKKTDKDQVLAGTRVCMVVYSYYPMDQRVRREAESLVERGAEVDIICARDNDEGKIGEHRGVRIYRLPLHIRKYKSPTQYVYQFTLFLLMAAFLLSIKYFKKGYHVVHVHSIPDFLVFCAIIPRLFGAKIVLDLHEMNPEVHAVRLGLPLRHWAVLPILWAEKASTRFAHQAITTNDTRLKIIKRRTGANDIDVIMNLPKENLYKLRDMSKFIKEWDLQDKFVLSYAGTLNPERELDVVFKAISIAKKRIPGITLVICGYGDDDYIQYLKELILEKELEDNIIFVGYVSLEELLNYVAISNVAISPYANNPSQNLGLPTKAFEYLMVPKPIIMSGLHVMRKTFGRYVLYYEPSNAKDLADKIFEIFSKENEWNGIAVKAQKAIFEKYDPRKMEQRLVNIYCKLLE